MAFWILAIGLFVLPLSGAIIIEPIISIIHNTKEMLALITCMLLIAYAHICGKYYTRIKNVSIFLLFVYLLFCINAAPKIKLIYGKSNIGNLWEWKAFGVALVYFLFYLSFSKIYISKKQKEDLCKIIGLTAVISSVYAIFQAFGLDQSQSVKTIEQIGHPKVPHITAMIGNPTYLSIYLVASLPFVWCYFKKYTALIEEWQKQSKAFEMDIGAQNSERSQGI